MAIHRSRGLDTKRPRLTAVAAQMSDLIERLRSAANALPPPAPAPPHPLYRLIHDAAFEIARLEAQIARNAATHHLSPIVRMLQELTATWSCVVRDGDYHGVTVFFECADDAEAFRIELMMAVSGQSGYEKETVTAKEA